MFCVYGMDSCIVRLCCVAFTVLSDIGDVGFVSGRCSCGSVTVDARRMLESDIVFGNTIFMFEDIQFYKS